MRVVAFYTENTEYEKEAEIWEESFKGCSTKVYSVPNQGSWEANCGLKPEILLAALQETENPVLYVDIDARLCRPLEPISRPDLPGFCFLNQYKVPPFDRQLASGTIYLPQSVISYKIVLEWIALQKKNPTVWDQVTLQHVVESDKYEYQILPPEWLGVDKHAELENPIIFHTQASRRLKSTVNE